MNGRDRLLVGCLTLLWISSGLQAGDWPMWRADAHRSAATSENLPAELRPLWTRSFTQRKQAWDDPLNLDLMTYDRVFEPIVLGGRLYVGFNDRDKLVAFDAADGRELWSFYTEGPVRLPAVGRDGKVYFCSDDGYLYCVDAASGNLVWKFRGAPDAQKAIGNQRVVSAWPARGGPVLRDDTIYFAASIWPFMGTFLYALNAETGEVQWVNDSSGSHYVKQPHSAPAFAGVAPQGTLVATENYLVVPGGRSVPAVFDRNDGKLLHFEINAGGKGTGGSFVVADDKHFFVHTRLKGTRAFDLAKGVKTAFTPNEPVLAGGVFYSAELDDKEPVVRAYGDDHKARWQVKADGSGDLILAGDRLYAAGKDAISIIRLPANDQPAKVETRIPVKGQIERLLVADGKLFAVTLEGSIMAFGADGKQSVDPIAEPIAPLQAPAKSKDLVAKLLASTNAEGYALWFGASEDSLIKALAADSPYMELAVVDADAQKVQKLRKELDAAGLYGKVTVHHSEAAEFHAPRYIANTVFVGKELAESADDQLLRTLYESVRPYGGTMHLLAGNEGAGLAERVKAYRWEQAEVTDLGESVVVRRAGRLPGSADWTHQYGDVANTIKSDDQRVKLPLGILWFGGSSNLDVLPRHGHGPSPQVLNGRLFIEGMNCLSARDVYTGRTLWKREFDDLGTFDVYYDDTYDDAPLDPKYNQVHIPGANGRGTNYVVTPERVYLVEGSRCHVLDPATGSTIQEIELPVDDAGEKREWGYVGVYEDVLLAGYGYAKYRERNKLSFDSDKLLAKNKEGFGAKSLDRAASLGLIAFDRHTGEVRWRVDARHSFWHNGIVAGGGKIYCLDRTPEMVEAALRRRGVSNAGTYRIIALDAKSGRQLWERSDVFGTWLGYSEEHDLLLQAGAQASDRLYAEVGRGMSVYHGSDGSLKWKNEDIKYSGPCILHNDWIITNANSYSESAGAFRLTDGKQKMTRNPLTGELQPWKLTRAYGCNSIVASEYLLTFRSGAAGFYDLVSDSGTGNFGGFKSGCTSNLLAADGVLNAPDYTRTCSCAYQNQTSLALVHMPDLEFWTINPVASIHDSKGELQRVGVNLGAPGDRQERDTLWLEHPAVGGPSPPLKVELNPEATFFHQHSTSFRSADKPWILASGADNVTSMTVELSIGKTGGLSDGVPINHAHDDAEERESGAVTLSSSDLEFVDDKGPQAIGLRFEKINLPRGSRVRRAYIQFVCDEPTSDPTTLLISAQDSGDAERFTEARRNVTSRPRTKAQIEWRPPVWKNAGDKGEEQRTPDLASLVQWVIDRDDWRPGNAIAFIVTGTGKRVASAFREDRPNAARLVIDADETEPESVAPPQNYRVQLLFAAPRTPSSTRRRFDVAIQGRTLLRDVVIDPHGPLDQQFAIHTFENLALSNPLKIELIPREGTPVLSGVEIVKQPGR